MISIQQKISRLMIACILTISIIIIGINIVLTNHYAKEASRTMLNETCTAQSLRLDNQFRAVERSVNDILLLTEKDRPSVEQLSNKDIADAYVDNFHQIAIKIADNTDSAIAVYYRVNPDLTGSGTTGFFWVKSPETGKFTENEITDLYSFDPEDVEHVGWYYIPVRSGAPIWMEPYYNQNINVEMISYVVPFYDGNRLIGVIGMDLDFSEILDITEDVDVYQTGSADLMCMSNSIVYHNEPSIFGDSIPSDLYNTLVESKNSDELLSYRIGKTDYKMSYHTLINNMKFIIYVPDSEIYEQRNIVIIASAAATIILSVILMLLTLNITKRITKPIQMITEATQQFAAGNWDAELSCSTHDELETLTESINIMADKTRDYISDINAMAYRDGLTGLKNKSCYINHVEELKKRIVPEESRFAVAVLDLNGLKSINDNLGHEAGDKLIFDAGKIICRYFSHSPVFRIGGDEFCVVMETDDCTNCDNIIADLRQAMKKAAESGDSNEAVIASGAAYYPDDGSSYDEVFKKADDRMYSNKTDMKGGVKPR